MANHTSVAGDGGDHQTRRRSVPRCAATAVSRVHGARRCRVEPAVARDSRPCSSTNSAVEMSATRLPAILGETTLQQRPNRRWHVSDGSADQSGSLFRHVRERVGDVLAVERAPARQHLVQHAAERPDVAALVDRASRAPAPGSCTPPCRGSSHACVIAGVVIVGDIDTLGDAAPGWAPSPSPARSRAPSPCRPAAP